MNARKINQNLPIMARAHSREDYDLLMEAGATEVIQPETEASATFIRHACGHYLMLPDTQIRDFLRTFRDAIDSAGRTATRPQQTVPEIREVTIHNTSCAGHSIREQNLREIFGVTIVSIKRASGELLTNPPADTILHKSDRLRVLGRSDQIDAFAAQYSANHPSQQQIP
jgi:voltage-gated potassium channel